MQNTSTAASQPQPQRWRVRTATALRRPRATRTGALCVSSRSQGTGMMLDPVRSSQQDKASQIWPHHRLIGWCGIFRYIRTGSYAKILSQEAQVQRQAWGSHAWLSDSTPSQAGSGGSGAKVRSAIGTNKLQAVQVAKSADNQPIIRDSPESKQRALKLDTNWAHGEIPASKSSNVMLPANLLSRH